VRWALLLGVAACFAPKAPSEIPCGTNDSCPAGQRCTPEGLCSSTPFTPSGDAPVDRDAATDSPIAPPDTPPVPPLLVFGERNGALNDTWVETFLEESQPANNMGTHVDIHLMSDGDGPTLIRIDVTAIPTYATVTAARLKFRVTADLIQAGRTLEVYAMNESWNEGDGNFSAGIANYTQRKPGMNWSTAGAKPPSRGNTPVAMRTFADPVNTGDNFEIELPASLIAGWVATPASNNGIAMMIATPGFYCELASSEADDADLRPVLEVELQ
jgi:hypothetical protein